MNENEILTLGIDINDDPLNQKVEAIEGKISGLQEKASSIAFDAQNTELPGYGEAIQNKLDLWNASLTDVVRARKAIDQANDSVERADLTNVFRRKVEMADKYIQDIQKSVGSTQDFVKDVTPAISSCLSDYTTQLKTAFRTVATRVTEQAAAEAAKTGTGSGMLSDKKLIDEFLSSPEYKDIESDIQRVNPRAATRKVMSSFLQSQMPIMLPQYMREDVAGHSAVAFRKAPESFREMVPPSYGSIPTQRPSNAADLRRLGSTENGNERLTSEEQIKLDRIVQRDHRAADAAIAAGVYGKSEGKLYYNPNATRDMVNAMGSFSFANDVVLGAKGPTRYGIQDVEDPNKWPNIAKKIGSNKRLDSGLRTARAMHDSFSWYNPGYYDYSDAAKFDPSDASTPKRYVGQIHQSPTEISRGFAEYTLDMMNQGVQITGNSPVKNKDGKWIAYPDVHGPQRAAKANGFVSVSPEDFHTIDLNGSLLMDLVHSMPHSSTIGHNGFDDSMIYLKHDDRLSNQFLPEEERSALRAEIQSRLENGYTANGKHYIPTRVSKTHTEFMWDKLVDDIGRYELGMAPDDRPDAPSTDEIRQKGLEVLRNGAGLGTFSNFKDFAKAAYNANLLATDGEDLSSYWGMKFGFTSNPAVEQEIARRKANGETLHPQQEQRVLEQLGTPNTKVVVGHFETSDGTKIMDGSNWAFNPAVQESFQGRSYGGKATYVKQSLAEMKRDNPNQIVENDITRAKIAAINPSVRGKKRDQMVQDIMMQYGDFVIPGAGIDEIKNENGEVIGRSDLLIPWDTDFVESDDNIKNKALFKDDSGRTLTQQELNERRSRDYSRWHVAAKTTYDDAGTSSRWLSRQIVNGQLAGAFQDPKVDAYFAKILQDEITHLDDEQYARDVLFGGDQTVDMTSEASQKVIRDHISNMIDRFSSGDRLLPVGVMSYSMAAPNPQNVVNEMILKSGQKLTPQQKRLHLGETDVVSPKSSSHFLSLIRFPATLRGNVKAANLWNSDELAEGGSDSVGAAIRDSFERRGLDKKGLYFNPASPILKDLQGMDFDGDKNGQFDLSSLFNIDNLSGADKESFAQMIGYLNSKATEQRDAIMLAAFKNLETKAKEHGESFPDASEWTNERKIKYVMENQELRKKNFTQTPGNNGKTYSLDNMGDIVDYMFGVGVTSPMMGQADRATDIIAALYDEHGEINPAFAQALLDHEDQYDVVSTHLKTAEKWANSEEQKNAASFGRSFARTLEWAAKDVTTTGQNDASSRVWDQDAQARFNARNFDQINLPTFSNGAVLGTLRARMKFKENGIAINGTDKYGNQLYDWDTILSQDRMPTSEAEGTEGAKLTMMLRRAKAGFLKGDYLALSQEDEDAILRQTQLARNELALATGNNPVEFNERWRAMGGNVAEQIRNHAYTQRAIEANPELKKSLEDYAQSVGVPVKQLYSGIVAAEKAQVEQQPEKQINEEKKATKVQKKENAVQETANQQVEAKTEEPKKPAEEAKKRNVAITTGGRVPDIQANEQREQVEPPEKTTEQIEEEQKQPNDKDTAEQTQKTAKEEARDLLGQKPSSGKKLNASQIDAILNLSRETIAAAVSSGDWKQLTTNGVGQATAEKAIELLKGSRYANYQPSSSPELGWKVAQKTKDQREKEAHVATESIQDTEDAQPEEPSAQPTKPRKQFHLIRGRAKELVGSRDLTEGGPSLEKINEEIEKERIKLLQQQNDDIPFIDSSALRSDRLKELEQQKSEIEKHLGFSSVTTTPEIQKLRTQRRNLEEKVGFHYEEEEPREPERSHGEPARSTKTQTSNQSSAQMNAPVVNPEAQKVLMQLAQSQFAQIMQGSVDFSKQLFGSNLASEQSLEEVPAAIQRLGKNTAIAKSYARQINEFKETEQYKTLDPNQKEAMDRLVTGDRSLVAMAGRDFMNYSLLGSKNMIEGLSKANDQIAGTYDPQIEALEKWKEKIAEVEKEQQKLQELSKDKSFSEKTRNEYAEGAKKLGADLERLKAEETQFEAATNERIALREQQRVYKTDQTIRQGQQMQRLGFGGGQTLWGRAMQSRNSALTSWQNYKSSVDTQLYEAKNRFAQMSPSDDGYENAKTQLDQLQAASDRAGSQIKKLSGPFGSAGAAAASFGNAVGKAMQRLGRQLFQKALQETKRFIKEFNASMTTIQMITLKTDSQMSNLGTSLIARAKELKVSVSEVTSSAEALYRQGLTDDQVSERLGVISKFSKVSGTKTDAATKLITVAMNTGLASDPTMVADIVTALGDNAATNASEIEKGIEKAGAAAAADGTTFAELASMLTAITSTTQMGGNTAGVTLNTIFGRMNKIGTNELIVDENGNMVSGSAIAQLLEKQGVKTYDENGNKRSSYDVLRDLSQKWEGMTDAEQQQIAAAIAGTRQYSNFAAIMQGMSEGKVDEYMSLAQGAEGTVDQKFGIYAQSLQGSLTDLKNTWDELVHDLTDTGFLQGAIGAFATLIKGVDNLTKNIGGMGAMLTTVLPMFAGFVMMQTGLQTGQWYLAVAGLVTAGVGLAVAGIAGNQESPAQASRKTLEDNVNRYESAKEVRLEGINKLQNLRSKSNRTKEENKEYANLIHSEAYKLGMITDPAKESAYSVENLMSALNGLSKAADEAADSVIKESSEKEKAAAIALIRENRPTISALEDRYLKERSSHSSSVSLDNGKYNGLFYIGVNSETGEKHLRLKPNASKYLESEIDTALLFDTPLLGGIANKAGGTSYSGYSDYMQPYFDLLATASMSGYMRDAGLDPEKGVFDQKYWQERFARGELPTQEELQGTVRLFDSNGDFNPDSGNGYNDYKTVIGEQFEADKYLKQNYTEDQYEYLLDLAARTAVEQGSAEAGYYAVMGRDLTPEGIESSVKTALQGFVPTVATNEDGLPTLGQFDYYVDENGNYVSAKEAQGSVQTSEQKELDNAVAIIQRHNAGVLGSHALEVARVATENAAGQQIVNAYNAGLDQAYQEEVAATVVSNLASITGASAENAGRYLGAQAQNAENEQKYQGELEAAQAAHSFSVGAIMAGNSYLEAQAQKDYEEQMAAYETARAEEEKKIDQKYNWDLQDEALRLYMTRQPEGELGLSPIDQFYADKVAFGTDFNQFMEWNPETKRFTWKPNSDGAQRRAYDEYKARYLPGRRTFADLSKEEQDEIIKQFGATWEDIPEETQKFLLGEAAKTVQRGESTLPVPEYKEPDWIQTPVITLPKAPKPVTPDYVEPEIETIKPFDESKYKTFTPETAPELDKSQIIGGIRATANAIKALYEAGDKSLSLVRDELEASKKAIQEDAKTYSVKTRTAAKAAENAYSSAEKGWMNQNKPGMYADTFTSMLLSSQFGGGTDSERLGRFLDAIGEDSELGERWGTLVNSNANLQRLMHMAEQTFEGNEYHVNEGFMDEFERVIQAGSLAYGSGVVTNQQKAAIASRALTGILDEGMFVSQEEKDFAQKQAYNDYLTDLQSRKNAAIEKAKKAYKGAPELDAVLAGIEEEYGSVYLDMDRFLDENPDLTREAMSPEQQAYLKEIVGEPLFGRLMEQNSGGTKLTDEEKALAELQISNRSVGLTSLTARNQADWLKQNASRLTTIGAEGGLERSVADTYMSQWSGWAEYAALVEAQNTGNATAFKQLGGSERLATLQEQLKQYQQNLQIQIEVEGLSTLEEAGKLLEGTAALVEKLKKGGRFEIEAVMTLRSELHSEGQTAAMLSGGTAEQQYQAIMELTGATLAQIERDPTRYREQAEKEAARRQEERRKQIETAYAYATDKEAYRQTLLDEGWDITGGDYTLGDQYFIDGNGEIREKATGQVNLGETARYRADNIHATYNGQAIDNANPYFGKSESYRNLQLAQMAQAIAYGTQRTDENYELYDAAVSASGYWTQRLAWLEAKKQTGTDEYETAKRMAQLEADQAAKEAEETQKLEDLKLSGNAFAYAQEQYRQNNKAGLAANALYMAITPENVQNWTDFANIIGNTQKDNWDELIKSAPELTKELTDLGVKFKEDGTLDIQGTIDSIGEGGEKLDAALSAIAALIGARSADFQNRDYQTRSEIMAAAAGFDTWDSTSKPDEASLAAARQVYGDTLVEKRLTAGYEWTEQDQLEARQRALNYQYGIDNITDMQAVTGIEELMKQMQAGTLTSYMQEKGGMDNALQWMSQFENAGRYFQMAQALEGSEFSMEKLGDIENDADAIERVDKLLESVGGSYKAAVNTAKLFHSELDSKAILTLRKYGDYSEDVAQNVTNLAKGGKTAQQTVAQLTERMSKLNNAMFAAQNARGKSGKQLSSKDLADLSEASGYTEGLIKEMSQDQVQKLIEDVESQVNEEFVQNIGGTIQEALQNAAETQDLTVEQLVHFDVNADGELDLSEIEAAAAALHDEGLAALASYAGYLGELFLKINKNATSVSGALEFSRGSMKSGGAGKRLGGGGGGGGGGESAADELLKKQKRDLSRLQHEYKMLEIQEKHYDRTNEYDDYMVLLDAEIAKQKELESLYASNVEELQGMLSGLSEADEDYDKVASALYEAQEALADISNQIDEINAKRIQIITEKQENEDKPQTHKLTQIGNLASRYMTAKEYENYYKASQMQIDATREQIRQNEGQIAEWENMLTQYVEGSDDWIGIRDKIWAMREENASLENQALEDIIAMNQQKISQISEELEHGQQFSNHAINMNSTYGDLYNKNGQYQDYRNTLGQQNTYYQTNIETYRTAIASLQALMATLDKTSDEWYSARDAIFQYEEAIAQADAAIYQNNQAIQESRVSELTTNYDHMTSDMQHELKMLQNQKQIYDDDNDFEAYSEMLRKEQQYTEEMTAAMRYSLQEMEAEIGNVDQDSDAWWNLHDKILSVREAISDAEVSLENFENQMTQSKIDHLIEKFGYIDDMDQHNIKLIQYEETRYQNRGELTNYGTMLGYENEYQQQYADHLTDHIRLLKDERENVEVGSDAYYKLEQTIAKYEEQLAATNNTIEKNTKLMQENQEKIRQTVMTVENLVDQEYRARIKKTRDMLAAEVSMQNTILETIKKRYQDEFSLEQRRIAKLKESLNQEKSLINERLNARKNAVDEANQYEELAEYKRQLALLSADPTRTKEAKELQKRIADMERDMAYQNAAAEAASEGARIDDEIKAYDDYLANAQEDLNMLLSDSNALMADAQAEFGFNVAELMAGSWTDLLAWLQENNVSYRNATEELQTQMVNGWEDTWKKMWGIIDTYWDDIHVIMADATSFMDYMKESDTYASRSETGQASLEYSWGDSYQDMINATIDNATYDHEHDLITDLTSKIDEARDWTYKVELAGKERDLIGAFGLSDYLNYGLEHTPVDVSDIFWDDLYTGIGKKVEPVTYTPSDGGGGGGDGGTKSSGPSYKYYDIYDEKGFKTNYQVRARNAQEAQEKTREELGSYYSSTINPTSKSTSKKAKVFETGGIVDYTGPAWVDGTKSRPEAFLSASDTERIAALTKALSYVSVPSFSLPNLSDFGVQNQTIGDINITINQADLRSDQDIELVAKQVGKAFSKQLSKQGLNLASVTF